MTVKLTVLYTKPDDPAAWDEHYRTVHLPMVDRWPGVQRAEVARVLGGPGGTVSPYHLVAEIWFADVDALGAALASEGGREAGRDFAGMAPEGSLMLVSEVE